MHANRGPFSQQKMYGHEINWSYCMLQHPEAADLRECWNQPLNVQLKFQLRESTQSLCSATIQATMYL